MNPPLRAVVLLGVTLTLPACTMPPRLEPARFGAAIAGRETLPLATVLGDPDGYAGKSVVVDGKVRAACTRRGCWMELAPTLAAGDPGCRVTFKDYGFFVPTNSAGASARVEGAVAVRAVPVGDVQHLESEGARFAHKLPDGSARELRIVATGVELRR